MNEIDDMTIMAFADGELPEDEAAKVAAAIEENPRMKETLDRHMALKGLIGSAFDDISSNPLPQSISDALANKKPTESQETTVISFPKKAWKVWGAPTLIAASIALFLFSTNITQTTPTLDFALPHQVASNLNSSLSSLGDNTSATNILVQGSYRKNTDTLCRTFAYSAASGQTIDTQGLACQTAPGNWQVVATTPYIPPGAFLPAGEEEKTRLHTMLETMEKLAAKEVDQYLKK